MEDKLREDFPIDWEEDHFVSRREFLRFMTLASGGLAVGSAALAVWSRKTNDSIAFDAMRICRVDEVNAGSARGFTYPRPTDLCILIKDTEGEWKAYSRRCTHLSCPVSYEPDKHRLYCPCHNGAFSIEDGRVLQGPPPHPLPKILIETRGEEIWAVGVAKAEHLS
ncbi:MAG: Rieske (2Fe-2S) protein [Fimbriimonadaceae bacterium]|nr:Rieske (2Fe-2S) protein [Fimbriimonadaceae bacterium]